MVCRIVACFLTLTAMSSPAAAEFVTFRLQGTIDGVAPNLGAAVAAGDRWWIDVGWETDSDENCLEQTSNVCFGVEGGTGQISEDPLSLYGQFNVFALPGETRLELDDHLGGFGGPTLGASGEWTPRYAQLDWGWSGADALTVPSFPAEMPAQWGTLELIYVQYESGLFNGTELGRGTINGHLESVSRVPEPSGLAFVILGVLQGGVILHRRRITGRT